MTNYTQREYNIRRIALHGFAGLAIVLVLCIFLSGTVKMIATAKVKLIMPTSDYLTEDIQSTGFLHFSEVTDLLGGTLPENVSLTVRKVHVTTGRRVSKGDVLFEAVVTDIDSMIETLNSDYIATTEELVQLRLQNAGLFITPNDESWIIAYDAYLTAQQQLLEERIKYEADAAMMGVALIDGTLPDGVEDDILLSDQEAVGATSKRLDELRERLEQVNRIGIQPEVKAFVLQERKLLSDINSLQRQITTLYQLSTQVQIVTAPHDGYILAVNIQEGEIFRGPSPAMSMSAEEAECYLQADVSKTNRTISEGTTVAIIGSLGYQIEGTVKRNGFDNAGNAMIQVNIPMSSISTLGGASNLLKYGVNMTVRYVSDRVSTLIPASAVRGNSNNYYVYTIQEERNLLGEDILTLVKQSVTIIEEAGDMVAILEAIESQRIAYMEDRSISEGSEIIPYND